VDPADQKLGIDSESIFDYFCGKGSTIKSNPLMYTYTLYGIVSLNPSHLSAGHFGLAMPPKAGLNQARATRICTQL